MSVTTISKEIPVEALKLHPVIQDYRHREKPKQRDARADEDERWQKADKLNERPDTCWANIVSWVLLHGDVDAIFDQSICIQPGADLCYCGKLTPPNQAARLRQTADTILRSGGIVPPGLRRQLTADERKDRR